MPGGWVAHNTAFGGGVLIPTESRLAASNQYEEIPFAFRTKNCVELCVGGWIALSSGNKQYPSEDLDRVFRQVGLSEQCAPYLVVTDDVPSMQRVFISQVRDELRDRHASSCPWDDSVRVHLEHVGHQLPHSPLFKVEAMKKVVVFHGLERCLALFKGTGLRNRVTLEEWIKVLIDLHRDTRDMRGDLMGCPSVT
jgi:hypothetical protein